MSNENETKIRDLAGQNGTESPVKSPAGVPDLSGVIIDGIGGYCPVEGSGLVDGAEFYFRSRGDSWSMSIGGDDVVGEPKWYYEEDYGDWPDAGYLTEVEALGFIAKAVAMYRAA